MGAKKSGKKKKKKAVKEVKPPVNPLPDFNALMKVPCLKWEASLDEGIDSSNSPEGAECIQECSKTVSGVTPMSHSFNRIKEEIQSKLCNSLGGVTLFYKDENSGERKELKDIMHKRLDEYLTTGDDTAKFSYLFRPFVNPMLEASVAMVREKESPNKEK